MVFSDGLDFWLRSPFGFYETFEPLCLIGPNGAGKSQFLQVLAEIFQAVFHTAVPEEEHSEGNPSLQFEVEYLIRPHGTDSDIYVRIARLAEGRRRPALVIQTRVDGEWVSCDLTEKDADGTSYEGYWWLAFDWQNFRIWGNAGNRKKGTFFPLRPGCARVGPHGDIRYEDAQLLDPIDEHDPGLLSFNMEGRAIPAAHLTDAWEKARVEYSVERYNLDFPPLIDKRKVVWAECWNRVREYLKERETYQSDETNVIARDRYKQAIKRVRELIHEKQELSAVTRACVLRSGDPRVTSILQST